MVHPELDETNPNARTAFSFGTPNKDNFGGETFISPITRNIVRFAESPEDEQIPADQSLRQPAVAGGLYTNYPFKSPNERLIDIKNATHRTKLELAPRGIFQGGRKLLYAVGPREAYVVDKVFTGDMNFLQLGELSHDGELLMKKGTEKPEYNINIQSPTKSGAQSSNHGVTPSMRRRLFEDMDKEHDEVVTSPHKYRRDQHF